MTTHKSAQAISPAPEKESDAGNLQGVIGYLPAAHGLTLAEDDIIQMVKIPNGATVIDCLLETGALGASVTAAVGDDADTDRYISATDHSSAALTRRKQTDTVGVPYTYSAQNTIDLVLAGGNPGDAVAICLYLTYICGVDTTP